MLLHLLLILESIYVVEGIERIIDGATLVTDLPLESSDRRKPGPGRYQSDYEDGKNNRENVRQELSAVNLTVPALIAMDDEYICGSWGLPPDENYIVDFSVIAGGTPAVYMMLYGCSEPAQTESLWSECRKACSRESVPLFGWARYSSGHMSLPSETGYAIGGYTGLSYLVLQVHFKQTDSAFPTSEDAEAGFRITVTPTRPQYTIGLFVTALDKLNLPAGKTAVHADVTCRYDDPLTIQGFAFRVNTHPLGQVVTSYLVNRKGNWILIGRSNPQWPQAYYPTANNVTISKGDYLVTRCTYDTSTLNHRLKLGVSGEDELCNLYMLYRTNSTGGAAYYSCTGNNNAKLLDNIPLDSDKPPPVNRLLEQTGGENRPIQRSNTPLSDQFVDNQQMFRPSVQRNSYRNGILPNGYYSSIRGSGRRGENPDTFANYPERHYDPDLLSNRRPGFRSEDNRQPNTDDRAGRRGYKQNELKAGASFNSRFKSDDPSSRDYYESVSNERTRYRGNAQSRKSDDSGKTNGVSTGLPQLSDKKSIAVVSKTKNSGIQKIELKTTSKESGPVSSPGTVQPIISTSSPQLSTDAELSASTGSDSLSDFSSSFIIMSILVVPLLIILCVTIVLRIRRSGKIRWLLLNRRHGSGPVSSIVGGLIAGSQPSQKKRRHHNVDKGGLGRLLGSGNGKKEELEYLQNDEQYSDNEDDMDECRIMPNQPA